MLTNRTEHVIEQIEAYLDNQLSIEDRRRVEAHLAMCSKCSRHLFNARRLHEELGPTMRGVLGQPIAPVALRYHIKEKIFDNAESRPSSRRWAATGRSILNAVGTLVIIALLAVSVLAVVRGSLPGSSILSRISSPQPVGDLEGITASSGDIGANLPATPAASRPIPTATTPPSLSSLGDTVPKATSSLDQKTDESPVAPRTAPLEDRAQEPTAETTFAPAGTGEYQPEPQRNRVRSADGTIAFAFYNPAPERKTYEIHLIDPNGANHRLFPLDGVSEPALRRTDSGGYQLAYRAWSEPTSPRSLLTSNLSGEQIRAIGGFWEDAQPDWSPTEERLIFASQREVDRRWRLYTIWGDGSFEVNLRREGKSPTFAPDGYRFAFEGCDTDGNKCGLWIGNLDDSEYGSELLLTNPLARSPDWSPVSEQVAYMAKSEGNNWDLYVINLKDRQVRRLTVHPAIDGLPAWSPDGEWLAFLSNRDGNWGIWTLHVASGQQEQIYAFDGGVFTPPTGPPYGERHWWDEQLSWSQ